jgi:hypothetical protein
MSDETTTARAFDAWVRRRGRPEPPPDEPPPDDDGPGLTADQAMSAMLRSRGTARIIPRKEPENG